MISFVKDGTQLLLEYQAVTTAWVDVKLRESKKVTIRKIFTFLAKDLLPKQTSGKLLYPYIYSEASQDVVSGEISDESASTHDAKTFILGHLEGTYFKIRKDILGLEYDLSLHKEIPLREKTFISLGNISIFRKIDELIDEPIVIGGDANGAIPLDAFNELLANFPTTWELTKYAKARVTRVLKDYLDTMSDAQIKLDTYLNQKKTIRNRSKIDFIKDYEPGKFEYVRDEINTMLKEVEATPDAFKEKDWQRQIVEFLLLIFPKYVAVLENVHIKDVYSSPGKEKPRYLDLLLVDANGNLDVIEVKRPRPHQLLSRKPGSRGNYTPNGELSEAVMQVEKYLFHLNKWGRAGELVIQEQRKTELPSGFKVRITNPKAMLILGRDKDFDDKQKFDFEIIRRKYANIVDIMTYDDLLRRLNNIIAMVQHNLSKLGTRGGQS